VKLIISERARRDIARIHQYWLEHRDSKELLIEELADAERVLTSQPHVGQKYPSRRKREVRRLLLPKTSCHVYYVVYPSAERVEVLAVWGAVRGRGPKL
jgi:plasmid stabilization system protein ParE